MMLGCVISADMDLIGQLQPHSPARFVEVTMDQALAARADRQAALAALRAHLGR
jgi:allophanate hydrolase subunit 2